MERKQIVCIGVAVMMAVSLSGCSNKENKVKNAIRKDVVEVKETKEHQSDFAKRFHIPDEVDYEVYTEDGKNGYKIKCPIDVSGVEKVSVFKEKQIDSNFDENAFKETAEHIFDDGTFSYVKPLDCYSMEELKEMAAKNKEKYGSGSYEDVESYLENVRDFQQKNYEEGKFTEGNMFENQTVYDAILIATGTIDGEAYHLYGVKKDGFDYCTLLSDQYVPGYIYTNNGYDSRLMYFNYDSDHKEKLALPTQIHWGEDNISVNDEKAVGDNHCKYSKEEAEKLALDFVNKNRKDVFSCALTRKTSFGEFMRSIAFTEADKAVYYGGEEERAEFDETYGDDFDQAGAGYSFYLERSYHNLSVDFTDFWWNMYLSQEKEIYEKLDPKHIVVPQDNCRVEVRDEGVVCVEWRPLRYEVEDVLTEDAELLDFSDIEQIAADDLRAQLEEQSRDKYQDRMSSECTISTVKLRYVTVKSGDEYSLVPAWIFTTNYGESTVMILNAIDGSLIYQNLHS